MPGSLGKDSWIYQHPGPVIGAYFSGNEPLAKAYWGTAMGMLGSVKSIMRESSLGTLSSSMIMDDGTEIVVESNYGKDRVFITAPVVVPVVEEEMRDFQFKFTSAGVILVGDDESVTYGVTFSVQEVKGDSTLGTVYRGVFPYQPTDHNTQMLVFYDKDSKIWTLRQRAIIPDDGHGNLNQADMDDITGDYFDQDTNFLVSYSFMTNTGGLINYLSTQYDGVYILPSGSSISLNHGIWNDPKNAIKPDYYETEIISFASYELPPVEWKWYKYHIEGTGDKWISWPTGIGNAIGHGIVGYTIPGSTFQLLRDNVGFEHDQVWKLQSMFARAANYINTNFDLTLDQSQSGMSEISWDLWCVYDLSEQGLDPIESGLPTSAVPPMGFDNTQVWN